MPGLAKSARPRKQTGMKSYILVERWGFAVRSCSSDSFAIANYLLTAILCTGAAEAQNAPVMVSLTQAGPQVVLNKSMSSGPPGTYTTAPGSVTFTIGSATGTLAVQGPAFLTGSNLGLQFQLSAPTMFTLSHNLKGFTFINGILSDAQSFGGLCSVSIERSTTSCAVKSVLRISTIYTDGGSYNADGISLSTTIELWSGDSRISYTIYFQWFVQNRSIQIADMDVLQETTYNPKIPDTANITLIAEKPTMVRVYATSPNLVDNATVVLHGFRGSTGAELPDSPRKPESSPPPYQSSISLPDSVDKEDAGKSLNFILPLEWRRAGDLTLNAELQLPPNTQVADPVGANFRETITFVDSQATLEIGYIPFCYQSSSNCASTNVATYDNILKELYPIKSGSVHYFRLFTPFSPWMEEITKSNSGSQFKAFLEQIFNWSTGRRLDQLAGWFPALASAGTLVGSSDPEFAGGKGHVFLGLEAGGDSRYIAETLAHEIGHNLGLHHTAVTQYVFFSVCGDHDLFAPWPYSTPYSQQMGFESDGSLRPSGWGDLMSYCNGKNGISPFDVRQLLLNRLLRPFPIGQPGLKTPPAQATGALESEQVLISGLAQRDGSAGSLKPLYRMPADGRASASVDGGSHCLRFSRSGGALGDYCFQLTFRDVESVDLLDRQYFTVIAPIPAGATRVALMAGSTELASLSGSATAPTLAITSPQTGATWNGGTPATVAWSAASADQSQMLFTVLYSSDAGKSWIPIALDIPDSQFSFDPATIAGGSNVMFRVHATNGMNSTLAETGPIQVKQTPGIAVASAVDFGTAVIGDVNTQTLVINNPGSGPLQLTSYSIDNPAFSLTSGFRTLDIGAGENVALRLRWSPSASGGQTGTLILASTDPSNPSVTVLLSGSATEATGCRFGLTATSSSAGAFGATGTIYVSASASTCSWNAASKASWITLKTLSGTGSGQVSFQVDANPSAQPRSGDVAVAGLTYSVRQAAGGALPAISVSPVALNFGNVSVGQHSDLTIAMTNKSNGTLTIQSLSISGTGFSVVDPPAMPFNIGDAAAQITIRFAPTAAANSVSGALTIVSNDPFSSPSTVSLTASATSAGGTAAINIAIAPVDFGNVTVGQTARKNIAVLNSGAAALTASIGIPNAAFTVVTNPFPLATGASGPLTIQFAPTAASAVAAVPMTLTTNDPAHATVTINLSGTGTATTATTTTLSVDRGTFDFTSGFPGGGVTGYYINRLTPPSYPATLRSVLVYFPAGELPVGTQVTILSSAKPGGTGGTTLTGLALQRTSANISAVETFVEVPVTAITINSGDFLVGFAAANPAGVYPAVVDGAASKQRSYIGSDGANFSLLDSTSVGAGNFGIRAKVDLGPGGGGGTGSLSASSATLDLGSTAVNTTASRTLTVTNSSASPLAVTLTTAIPFSVVPPTLTIGAGSTFVVQVNFTPISSTPMQQQGTLTISAPGINSVTVALTGTTGTSGGGTCFTAPANLVSWWTGNGNASDAWGGNSGTLQSGGGYATGEVGQAFNLNGTTAYVQIGNPANLRLTSAVTIEAWINPRSVRTQTAGSPMGAIVTKWAQNFVDTADADSYGLWLIQGGNSASLFSAIHQAGSREPNIQGGTIPLNAWTHVAMTFDGVGGQYVLYVNGRTVASTTAAGTIYTTNRNVQIGHEDSFIGRAFDGLVDEVAIYSRALTASEVLGIYNASTAGKCVR